MNLDIGGKAFIAESRWAKDVAPKSKMRLRIRVYAGLLLADILVFALAFMAANMMRFANPFEQAGINIFVVLLPLYLGVAASRATYGGIVFRAWRIAAWRAMTSLSVAAAAVLFISFYLQASAEMSRMVFTIGIGICLVGVLMLRWTIHAFGRRLMGTEPYDQILIRDGMDFSCEPGVIALEASALGLRPDITDPIALDRIGKLLSPADRVVIACPEDRRAAWAVVLKGANVNGEILTPELQAIGSLGAGHFQTVPTLMVALPSLDLRSRALKRGLDIAIAGTATLVLAPLMVVTAIAVRLESAGPILFVQQRLGRGNRLFPMYKFRSMRSDLCDATGATSTARGDKRVTRVGRIIRAASIDELPQLLNVLRGDMSIVGPRPHALGSLAGDKLFWEVDQRYWHRHAAKPGITGLAQVRGFRGATHLRSDLVARLQADLDYVNGWSIWRDIFILIATLRVVFHRNAY